MNFTLFDHKENIDALAWLGRRDWIVYKNLKEQNAVFAAPVDFFLNPRPKVIEEYKSKNPDSNPIIVNEKEIKQHPPELWQRIKLILDHLQYDPLGTFWYYALSKSLANGPKIFQPLKQQCEALQNSSASYSFEDYKQPYPVIILEIPEDYRQFLKEEYEIQDTPKFVFVHHDEKNKFINVSAFFNMNNVITHFTPEREKYKTIEDNIIGSRKDYKDNDFLAAENVQRLGINFAMMMSLYSVKSVGPYSAPNYKQWEQDVKIGGKLTRRMAEAKTNLTAALHLLQFEQNVSFYDEINENSPIAEGVDIGNLRHSPKTHWRRGHFASQPCGIGRRERKIIFRKPVMIRAAYFFGDNQNTTVVYKVKQHEPELTGKIKVIKAEDIPENTVGTIFKTKKFNDILEIQAITESGDMFNLISPPDIYEKL